MAFDCHDSEPLIKKTVGLIKDSSSIITRKSVWMMFKIHIENVQNIYTALYYLVNNAMYFDWIM